MEYLDEGSLVELGMEMTRDKVKDDLDLIRNWVNRQPHLPALEDNEETNDWLYHYLFYSKNRIENVKNRLDAYFACKTLMPEFYANRDPEDEGIRSNVKALYLVTLPKPTPDGYRVHVFCHAVPDPNAYDPKDFMRRALMMCDWKMKNDLTAGDIIIMHMKHSSLIHWGRYNLLNLSRFVTAVTKAYPLRIKCIYFVQAPSFINLIVNNPFMPAKIKDRIKIHTEGDILSCIKDVPKECLPMELGGTMEATLEELNDSTYQNILSMKTWFRQNENAKSDESKRPPALKDNSLFGCEGTFRNLVTD